MLHLGSPMRAFALSLNRVGASALSSKEIASGSVFAVGGDWLAAGGTEKAAAGTARTLCG